MMFALLCVCSKPSATRIRFARTLFVTISKRKIKRNYLHRCEYKYKYLYKKYKYKWTNRTLKKAKSSMHLFISININVLGPADRRQREICCSSICNNWRSCFTPEGAGPRIFIAYLLDIFAISLTKKCLIFFLIFCL